MAENRILSGALVLVGDGRRVIFLRNEGSTAAPRLQVESVLEQSNPATREQGSDRPGSYSGAPGTMPKSGFEQTDWHQLAEDRFAADVGDALYRMAHAGRFDSLVVVAPPRVLGTLRSSLRKEVVERITAEIPKELTSHTIPEIASILTS